MKTRDLAHGFVVGSWQQPKEPGAPRPEPYPARLGTLWNGFENPYFDRETTERFIADQAALVQTLSPEKRFGVYTFAWDGKTLLIENKVPRPGTASAEEADRPGRIESTYIEGDPHWNVGLGWSWEQVTQAGEPVSADPTAAQIEGERDAESGLARIRETLRIRNGLRRRLDDGSDEFPVTAHLGGHEDHGHKPIPIHVHVGTVTLRPDGRVALKLEYDGALDCAGAPHLRLTVGELGHHAA